MKKKSAIFSLAKLKGISTDQMLHMIVKMSSWKQIKLLPCYAIVLKIKQNSIERKLVKNYHKDSRSFLTVYCCFVEPSLLISAESLVWGEPAVICMSWTVDIMLTLFELLFLNIVHH